MNKLLLTSSQTVGPFFAPALLREDAVRNRLVSAFASKDASSMATGCLFPMR